MEVILQDRLFGTMVSWCHQKHYTTSLLWSIYLCMVIRLVITFPSNDKSHWAHSWSFGKPVVWAFGKYACCPDIALVLQCQAIITRHVWHAQPNICAPPKLPSPNGGKCIGDRFAE